MVTPFSEFRSFPARPTQRHREGTLHCNIGMQHSGVPAVTDARRTRRFICEIAFLNGILGF